MTQVADTYALSGTNVLNVITQVTGNPNEIFSIWLKKGIIHIWTFHAKSFRRFIPGVKYMNNLSFCPESCAHHICLPDMEAFHFTPATDVDFGII